MELIFQFFFFDNRWGGTKCRPHTVTGRGIDWNAGLPERTAWGVPLTRGMDVVSGAKKMSGALMARRGEDCLHSVRDTNRLRSRGQRATQSGAETGEEI